MEMAGGGGRGYARSTSPRENTAAPALPSPSLICAIRGPSPHSPAGAGVSQHTGLGQQTGPGCLKDLVGALWWPEAPEEDLV